jgi:hypothetical protein
MNCRDYRERLKTEICLEEQLNNNSELAEHYRLCTSCQTLSVNLLNWFDELNSCHFPNPNPFLGTRIMGRIESLSEKKNYQILHLSPVMRSSFFIFVMVLGLFTGFLIGNNNNLTYSSINTPQINELEEFSNAYYFTEGESEIEEFNKYLNFSDI